MRRTSGGFSYGFRPGRSPHRALDALAAGVLEKRVNWVLDADIRDFFGSLDLHPGKTRLIEFGRHAARRRAARGEGKPETFAFPGFTHICATSRRGRFRVRRKTDSKRMRAKLKMVKDQLRRRRYQPIPEQVRWLAAVVR